MKKTLGIIGVGLIAGATAYVLYNKCKKTRANRTIHQVEDSKDTPLSTFVETNKQIDSYSNYDELKDTKMVALGTMYSRHEESAKIMRDAVEIISNTSDGTIDKRYELDLLSNELEQLLSEE